MRFTETDRTFSSFIMILLAVLALCSTPGVARAYRTASDLPSFDAEARVAWQADLLEFEVLRPNLASVDALAAEEGLQAALAVWNTVDCGVPRLEAILGAPLAAQPEDGRNTIEWVGTGWTERGFSSSAAATTDVQYRRLGELTEIVEADIYLNADLFRWGIDGRDPQAVLVHEIAHVLGLLHVCSLDATGSAPMCTAAHLQSVVHPQYLGLSQRRLGSDDLAGACFLYADVGCSDGECPAGYRCGDTECEPTCGTDCECRQNIDCSNGRCDAGVCVEVRRLGDPCAADAECSSQQCHTFGYCSVVCTASCPARFSCDTDIDAQCVAERSTYGVACSYGNDCTSGLCVSGSWFSAMCTRTCGDLICPGMDTCEVVDGHAVCTPPRSAGAGCSVVGQSGPGPASWVVLSCVMALARRRRR